jgi:cobalt-zinc-cadmium efflux system outer membrane protein
MFSNRLPATCLGLACLVWGWAESALAAGDPPPTALEALVAEALQRNPEVLEARAALDAARERPPQAGALDDPMIGIVYTNDGWTPSLGREDMTTLAVMGSQALPYPGKRKLRTRIAAADADLAAAELERVRRTIAASVARAYWNLTLARGLGSLADEKRALWQRVEETARALYAAGPGGQLDVFQAQAEAARVEEERVGLATDSRLRQAEINRLLTRALDTPVETPDLPTLVHEPRDLSAITAAADATVPEAAAAAVAVERGRLAIALARRQSRPDFAVQGAYMNRGSLPAMWQAGITASLPVRRARRRASVAEAEARLRQAESRAESVRLTQRLRVEERMARLGAIERIASIYRDTLIPQRRLATDSALATYSAGVGSQVAVLATLNALIADRSEYVRVLVRHALGRVALEEAALEPDADGAMERAPSRMVEPRMVPMAPPPGAGDTATPSMEER